MLVTPDLNKVLQEVLPDSQYFRRAPCSLRNILTEVHCTTADPGAPVPRCPGDPGPMTLVPWCTNYDTALP